MMDFKVVVNLSEPILHSLILKLTVCVCVYIYIFITSVDLISALKVNNCLLLIP